MHSSNCSWAWLCALRTNRLEEMANKLACLCIQMTYAQLSLTIMGIIAYVQPFGVFFFLFLFFFFFFLRLGLGQRRSVVIIGRWLLPSLVDTGDICCHYWQHILVLKPILLTNEILRVAFAYLVSWRQPLRVDGPKASQRSIIYLRDSYLHWSG